MTAIVIDEIWPLERIFEAEGSLNLPYIRSIAENLCHVYLSNGWIVSILVNTMTRSVETWAWADDDEKTKRTGEPVWQPSIDEALAYVEEAKTWDDLSS